MAGSGLIDSNTEEVGDWFDEQGDLFGDDVEEMLASVTDRTHEVALEKVPVDTGRLRDSLQKGDQTVFSELGYAPHVGLGTIYMDKQDYLFGPARKVLKNGLKQLADKRS
jgi:hypothetical protein